MKSSNQESTYSENQTNLLAEKIGYSIPLNILLKREGGEDECYVRELVIDGDEYVGGWFLTSSTSNLDQLESSVDRNTSNGKPKSTDIVFTLEDSTILLSECKLNMKPKLSSLSKQQLTDKVTDMMMILSEDLERKIMYVQPVPILFANDAIERAKLRIRRWYPGKTNYRRPFIAMTTADFLRRFFGRDV